MKAVCLITLRPSHIWCEFLNSFTQYPIFVVVDDNNFDLSTFVDKYKNITFITVDNQLCDGSGFKNLNSLILFKLVTGWDKAIYYFAVQNQSYDYVWFIEDDVFFYNEKTLTKIDEQFETSDLLSNTCTENKDGRHDWLWHKIKYMNYSPPYYWAMMCASRLSRELLKCIHKYATENSTLFFLEAAFPTIARKNNLQIDTPLEFRTIHWLPDFDKTIIESRLYHPVKDLNKHIFFRNKTLPVIYMD